MQQAHNSFKTKTNKAMVARVRAILVDRFPACFVPSGEMKKPLKIGIGQDIAHAIPELGSYEIGVALLDYTHGARYCEPASIEGAPRFNLEGKEDGKITHNEAAHMRGRLERFLSQHPKVSAQVE